MKTAIVTYSNGAIVRTSINGTEETIKKYFSIGKYFNIGSSEDNLQKVVSCEVLPDETLLKKAKELIAKGYDETYIDAVLISSKGANTSLDDITHAINYVKSNLKALKTGEAIEVLCHNYETKKDEWIKGEFIAYRTALDIDFRIDCKLSDGREIEGAHPDCVRLIGDNSKEFKIRFKGRKLGAIGKFYNYTKNVKADNLDGAILSLYDKYEHIRILSVKGKKFDYNKFTPTYGGIKLV